MERIFANLTSFVDEYGRERIFSGFNLGFKNKLDAFYGYDFEPDILYMKKCGMNVVRYFVNWAAVEPSPGEYNEKELEDIQKFLDLCEKHNMYVYLDMHQDLYGAFGKIGTKNEPGDGAPKWATNSDGYKYHTPRIVWAEGYFIGKAVHRAFDNFWNNVPVAGKGLQDHFADMWKMLAHRFGNHPALMGYDFLNEPFPGTDGGKAFFALVFSTVKTVITDKSVSKKELLKAFSADVPLAKILKQIDVKTFKKITQAANGYIEKFDKEKYSPFINKIAGAIREETDKGIFFFENSYYSNLGIPFSAEPISVGGKREMQQAFAPHAYDFMVDTPLYKFADNERVKSIFEKRREEQITKLNVPIMVGEWGGGAGGTQWLHHVEFLLDYFDENKWSNTYWCYGRNLMNSPLMNVLCRPYPVAVTGDILSYHYDRINNIFYLDYTQDKDFDVPTVIFAHEKIESIITDGMYEKKPVSDDASYVLVMTSKGSHHIEIKFQPKGFSYSSEGRKPQ